MSSRVSIMGSEQFAASAPVIRIVRSCNSPAIDHAFSDSIGRKGKAGHVSLCNKQRHRHETQDRLVCSVPQCSTYDQQSHSPVCGVLADSRQAIID